jgi:hypothetical protein
MLTGQSVWTLPKSQVKKVAREHAARFKLNMLERERES